MIDLVGSPTQQPEAERILLSLQTDGNRALIAFRDATVAAFREIWKSGRTAALLAAMGTKGKANFEKHAAAVQFLAAIGLPIPSEDCVPPVPYRVNPDNSVSLV